MALKGGTLSQLAADNKTTVQDLQKLNPTLNANTTYDLSEVKLPSATSTTQTATGQAGTTLGTGTTPQTGLSKVATQGIGPDGQPIYDVFSGQEHIQDPNDPRLKGVNIPNLPTGTAPTGFKSKFEAGFDQANADLGGNAPNNKNAGLVNNYVKGGKNDLSSMFVQNDEVLGNLVKTFQDYINPANQRTSLREEYDKMLKDTGIQNIDMELVDMKKVIEGSEDDIRNEITASGNFATESQIVGLANSRNKQLVKNYNALLETRNAKEKYLNTAIGLEASDRQAADQRFESAFSMGLQLADYEQKMKKNAIESLDRTVSTIGWTGLAQMVSPYEASLIEKAYGLPQGGLLAAAKNEQSAMAKVEEKRQLETQSAEANIANVYDQIANREAALSLDKQKLKIELSKLGLEQQKLLQDQITKLTKEEKALESQASTASTVLQKVKEAGGLIGGTSTGLLGGILSRVGGTNAKNLQGKIDTIKANLSFETLQAMRAASPTGGALGNVSDTEIRLLGATVASLDIGQSASQLQQSLKDIATHYSNWLGANGYSIAPDGNVYQITR